MSYNNTPVKKTKINLENVRYFIKKFIYGQYFIYKIDLILKF
jgi:hypothetical protein